MIKLLSWNILEGLRDLEEIEPKFDEARLLAARQVVLEENPDILVLNEALYGEPWEGVYHDYAKLFNLPYKSTQLYAGPWGNVILSKFPIIQEVKQLLYLKGDPQNRGALAAQVQTEQGPLWVATLHPHPKRRAHMRAEDFNKFLRKLNGPLILCGDFNAISPEDEVDATKLTQAFKRFCKHGQAASEVERFMEAGKLLFDNVLPKYGINDLMPQKDRAATMPTQLISSTNDSDIRIDHILGSIEITTMQAKVIKNKQTNIASDHYPIYLEFAIEKI